MRHLVVLSCLLALPAAAQQRTFGTLVLVETEPVPGGASPLSARTPAEWRFVELIYAPLMAPDGAGGYENVLAAKVSLEDGGQAVRITLRDDARWSNEREITALDVAYTYELARTGKWNGVFQHTLANVSGVEKGSDGFGVTLRLRAPITSAGPVLAVPLIPHGLHGPLNDEARQRPLPLATIGAGPFKLMNEGDSSRFVASATSVRPPKISEIRVLSVGSRAIAADVVRLMGDAVTFELARPDAAIAAAEFGVRRLDAPRTRVEVIAFDPKASPLGDPAIRAAFGAAIDRSELFASGAGGRAGAAPVSRRSAIYPKDLAPVRNADAARAGIASAGWTVVPGAFAHRDVNGSKLQLELPLLFDGDDPEALRRVAVLAARLKEVGIELAPDPRPRLELLDRVRSRQFPAALVSLEGGTDDSMPGLLRTGGALNVLGWSSGEVDGAIDRGDLAAAVRAAVDAFPALFLGVRADVGAVGKNVTAPAVLGKGGFARIDRWQIR